MSTTIAFYSPVHAGSTTLLLETALRMAQRRPDLRLLVLDLNLATPSAAFLLGQTAEEARQGGLESLIPRLVGQRLDAASLQAALWTYPRYARLQVLPGVLDVLAAERLAPAALTTLLAEARHHADLILVDTTPSPHSPGCLPVLTVADRILLISGPRLADRLHTRRYAQLLQAGGLAARTTAIVTPAQGLLRRSSLTAELELPVGALIPPSPGPARWFTPRRHRSYQAALDQVLALIDPQSAGSRSGFWARLRQRRRVAP